MHVCSKDTDTVIFREHDTQVYENKNANPEEEKYRYVVLSQHFCKQLSGISSCSQ